MNSNELRSKVIEEIDGFIDEFANTVINETLQREERRVKFEKKAEEVFDRLDRNICAKIIKMKLPFFLKLFYKVNCHGFSMNCDSQIEICFELNNNSDCRLYKRYSVNEIEFLLNKLNKN